MPKVPLDQIITPGSKAFVTKKRSDSQKNKILKKLKQAQSHIASRKYNGKPPIWEG